MGTRGLHQHIAAPVGRSLPAEQRPATDRKSDLSKKRNAPRLPSDVRERRLLNLLKGGSADDALRKAMRIMDELRAGR